VYNISNYFPHLGVFVINKLPQVLQGSWRVDYAENGGCLTSQ
jgi:hypothetical protein